MMYLLVYDGTFEGYLTCIFEIYKNRWRTVRFIRSQEHYEFLFHEKKPIQTDSTKSDRVWSGLIKKGSAAIAFKIYKVFLSEAPHVEVILQDYIQYLFKRGPIIDKDYGHSAVVSVAKTVKSVNREKHRMEAFVRFRLTKDNIYFASIVPDFNVIPLIIKHFKNRYSDQKWIIYDLKRKYGIYYDLEKVEHIYLDLPKSFDPVKTQGDFFDSSELKFQELWRDYFKSTNIESRRNDKLHVQHVPKRYWKYLSEKTQ
ncbi:MAG: TIGR03915 family putative DNA repair protein [Flavobacteriales bacterium]|nr:TIGR03915 family putative DNA repair protein [Flavobacteriales bacterium]